MNRLLLIIISALLVSWTTLTLSACHPEPKHTGEDTNKEKGKEENEEEGEGEDPDTVRVTPQAFFLPLDRFGEQLTPTVLDQWAESVGATLQSSDAEARYYTLPTDTLSAMILHTPRGIYREMTLMVPAHPFPAEEAFLSFLRRQGFQQSLLYPYLWFHKERALWMEYYTDEATGQDIHYYAGAELAHFALPFTQLRKDVSRQTVREQLAAEGYQYNKEESDLYTLTFDQPEGAWQRVIIYYDKTSEQPVQAQMLTRDRYVLHSPTIAQQLEQEGFYSNPKRHRYEALSYLHDEKELQVELIMSENPAEAKVAGGLILSYHANPNAPVEISRIDFPSFQWGATHTELETFEKERGRMPQMFLSVLNVDTGDPNFIHHAYFFDGEGKYNRAETIVSRAAVVQSKAFVQLMRDAGFDYDGEKDGEIRYFNDFQHIVAVIDLKVAPISITYMPLGL